MADPLAALMGKAKKSGPAEEPAPASAPTGGDASSEAAADALAAIKAGDAKALNLALKRHYEACAASEGDDEDEADDEEY